MSDFEKFIPSVDEEEKYILSHILRKPTDYALISEADLISSQAKHFYRAIDELYNKQNINRFDINLLRKTNVYLEENYVNDIFNIRLKGEENLKTCIKKVMDYSIKMTIGSTVEKFLMETTLSGDLNYDTITSLANDIISNTIKLGDNSLIKTYADMAEDYKKVLEKRKIGEGKRSLGFKSIDRIVIRPGAPGEMTTLFGMKGSGKSLLAKCIEMMLVNLGVCVVSINLEMTEESNMDRLVSIPSNFSLSQLLDESFLQEEEAVKIIYDILEDLSKKKNYIYISAIEMSLIDLDKLLYKCKLKFKELGVLPEDEYMFLTSDLTEQIEELSGKQGTELKPGVNKLLKLCKKHKIHKMNILQSNENIFRAGKTFSTPEACENFTLQPESVEGGSVYAARSRVVLAVNRPLLLKRRYFPQQQEEWDLETDLLWLNVVKQNDAPVGRTPFVFSSNSFRLIPYVDK